MATDTDLRALYEEWLATEKEAGVTRPPSSWSPFAAGWAAHVLVKETRGASLDREQWLAGRADARRELGAPEEAAS